MRLWGREVGRLLWDSRKGCSVFQFSSDFLKSGWDVSPIDCSISRPAAMQAFWGDRDRKYQGLPPFLSDSLPDSWGNKVFEQWARENGIRRYSLNPLEKLAYIGRRGMGAFEFEPEATRSEETGELLIQKLADLAERIYSQREDMSVVYDENLSLQALYEIGTSAGGRQAKAIIAMDGKGQIRSGQTDLPPDFVHYIMKFDVDAEFGHPGTVLEMVYHDMAAVAGINMMPARLMEVGGRRHYLTQRFDRIEGRKVHVQTLSAMNPAAESYEDLMRTVRLLGIGKNEQTELFRQTVFNFLAGNTDDHNKNFSFMMAEDGIWHLAPAYDLTFTMRSPSQEFPHCLSLRGKLSDVTIEDLVAFAKEEGISAPMRIIEEVMSGISKFYELCRLYRVPPYWIRFIGEALRELAPEGYRSMFESREDTLKVSFEEDGILFTDVRMETSEKGNVHLYAVSGGQEYRYVISRGTPLAEKLRGQGMGNQTEEQLHELVRKFILPKIRRT